ncbi:MAG TPA: hypothetical protein VFU40_10865 [Gemmatimonadales bacterium]|nr:hypothetical protein [Gemmatimonadales bacterium]
MTGEVAVPWVGVLLLGVWHGVNPGMGWLFAVALGLQEGRGSAVWRSLSPLAAGHALAVGVAVAVAVLLGQWVPLEPLRWAVAGILVAFGAWRLLRGRHPRWVGMRVSPRELATWSFLMASAHGAGLMLVPFVLGEGALNGVGTHHVMHAALVPALDQVSSLGVGTTLAHTAGYLLATGLVALLVYRRLGLRLLGKLWVNLDLVWGGALVATGVLTVLR